MRVSLKTVFEAALRLPENERLALASRLLETVSVDDSAISLDDNSLVQELDRRFADDQGSVEWCDLRAEK